jgi:hypothetical protein
VAAQQEAKEAKMAAARAAAQQVMLKGAQGPGIKIGKAHKGFEF